jgi:Raf kinase inhibitor-like YbhB/YbcL family protein
MEQKKNKKATRQIYLIVQQLFFCASFMKELQVRSPAFQQNQPIPKKYSCKGNGINPPLSIEGAPKEAKTLALIMDDPDAPSGTFDHWIVWNIPPSTKSIEENTVPGTEGLNGMRKKGYTGPCPPSGTHKYFFKVYALDTELKLGSNSRKSDAEKAMQGHILAKGELIGLFSA